MVKKIKRNRNARRYSPARRYPTPKNKANITTILAHGGSHKRLFAYTTTTTTTTSSTTTTTS